MTARLPPGIDRLPSGLYRVRYRDANRIQHGSSFRTLEEAKRFQTTTNASVITGTYVDPNAARQSFHAFALEWAAAQDWKETTREGFPYVLARVERGLAKGATLGSVDQLAIKRVRVELGREYAAKTVTLSMTYVLGIMRAAYRSGRIPRDVTIGASSQRRRNRDAHDVTPEEVPTRAEVTAIWSAAPPAFRAAIALGVSGLRVGEVLGMTADRVDVEHGLVTVDRQMQRIGNEVVHTTPKGEKARTIRVPSSVALELRRHLREQEGDGILFRGGRGALMRRPYFYAQAWRPALVAAGLAPDAYVFHSLRHFCASSMLAEGVNLVAVAGHLGDTVETVQRVYAHWMREDRDVPAEALEQILRVERPSTALEGGGPR